MVRTIEQWREIQRIADKNARLCMMRGLPEIQVDDRLKGARVAIVGGGPSVASRLEELSGYDAIIAVNGAHDYLAAHGVSFTHWLSFDQFGTVPKYLKAPLSSVTYWPASCCVPLVFDRLKKHKVEVWHALQGDDHAVPFEGSWVGGGPTSPLRAIALAYGLGAREIDCFGMDSSFSSATHAYHSVAVRRIAVDHGGRRYITDMNMREQALYMRFLMQNRPTDLIIEWKCEGLGPDLARM